MIHIITVVHDFGCPVFVSSRHRHHILTRPRAIGPAERECVVNANRHTAQSLARSMREPCGVVVLLDSDVITNDEMIEELAASVVPGFAVCAQTKFAPLCGDSPCCAFCAMTRDDYLRVNYEEFPDICQCQKIKKAMSVILHPSLKTSEVY